MNETLLLVIAFAPSTMFLWVALVLWRDWRRHRRIMAVLREVERTTELFRTSQDPEHLRARYERAMELLEHAARIMKEK